MKELEPGISKLGFGMMRLPKDEEGVIKIEDVKEMVDAYFAAGGNYIDTARAYGESESAVRRAVVERYPRDSFYLATKNAAWIGNKSREEAIADFDKSLEETGAGYFDFYLIHNTGDHRTKVFDDYKMWDFVAELKAQGKVRHIGFSHHDNAELLEQLIVAHPEMEFVQLQVNYADWTDTNVQSRKCVEVARKHGLPIIVMEPVRGGTLATPPEPVAQILRDANPDASYASWAIRFALGQEGVMTVLSGMSTLDQVTENVDTWLNFVPLSEDEHAVLVNAQQTLADIVDNPCTSCHYCSKGCPMGINIACIMQALNRNSIYGFKAGKGQYGFGLTEGHRGSDCIQCYQCEGACPQHIPIVSKIDRAVELFEA